MAHTIRSIFFILLMALGTASCGGKKTAEPEAAAEEKGGEEHGGHAEEESSIVALTDEQIKTAGIAYGSVESKELGATIKLSGRLEVPAQNKAVVTSLYGGILRTLNASPGRYVNKGQSLGTVVNTEMSGVQQQLISVNAQLRLAELEYKRQDELVKGNAAPLKNLQRAQAELSSLRAQRSALSQQLSALGISASQVSAGNISTTLSITAPISGTVADVKAQIGSNVDPSTPIATIVNNSALHLDLFAFEKDLPLLRVGQTIHFSLTNAPGKEYDARIYSIGTAFTDETRSVPVHAEILGDKTGLIDGMSATALVSLGGASAAASVPNEAIVNNGGKDYIFIVTDKKPEEHGHEEEGEDEGHGEKGHEEKGHKEEGHEEKGHGGESEPGGEKHSVAFERIQVVRGKSDLGFTVIQPVEELPAGARVVTKGAFFVMAKMTNTGGHEH